MDEAKKKNLGRPSYWPGQETVKFDYKGPADLAIKIDAKVKELKNRGVPAKFANKSFVQRVCVEKGIEHVDRVIMEQSVS